jgi:hypothetical protein
MEKKIRFKPKKKWPNWREPEDYASMKNLNLNQWAWEFLKRNRKYIELWKRFTNHLTEEQKRVQNWYYLSLDKGAFKAELCDATMWGLQYGYLNPDPNIEYRNIPFIPLGGKETVEIVSGGFKGAMVLGMPDYNTGSVLFEFNFNQPIIPQIKVAKKELLKLQKASKEKGNKVRRAFKPRRDEWTLLVRILDATAAGAKDKEIASVFFPDECSFDATGGIKKVYDKRDQAMRYVNQDYRSIPYSEQ